MQNSEIIIPTLLTSATIGGLLVLCIAYVLYYYNKKQFLLQAIFDKEIIKAQMEIQESTFIHISQELHDNIAQQILLAKFYIVNSDTSSLHDMQATIEDVKAALDNSLYNIRSLSKNMNSNFITENGLWHSVENFIEQVKKASKVSVIMNEEGPSRYIDSQIEIMLFRIVQEAVTNFLKHSGGDQIVITFHFKPDLFELTIHDNGVGFNVSETINNAYKKGSLGLQNIIKRTKMINGKHKIISQLNKGTVLCITIPC